MSWNGEIGGFYGQGPFDLDYGTLIMHVGDFNFVGYQQVETIRATGHRR